LSELPTRVQEAGQRVCGLKKHLAHLLSCFAMPVSSKASSKKLEELLRQRESGFSLNGVHQEKLPDYNALVDRNLRHHFESRSVQKHLGSLGLVDQRGRIVDLDRQKSKLSIIEQEFKLAEQAERVREREEEEIRRRVQMKRHDAIKEARQREKLMQLKEEKKIAREIVQAAKGYSSVGKPGSSQS
jgi:hypothetical protein